MLPRKRNVIAIAVITGIYCSILMGCSSGENSNNQVHQAIAAGKFYPNNAKELNALIKKAFRKAPAPKLKGELIAVVLPHAGYVYSGVITAIGMRAFLTKKNIDTIYILGSSHYADVGGAIIWQGRGFQTPLGLYPVDLQATRELVQKCPDVHLVPRVWEIEHSVEVQIPFLQKIAPKAKIVPLVMGTSTWRECWSVARAISDQASLRRAMIIISTDMSHYPSYQDAKIVDKKMIEPIVKMDVMQLDQDDRELMSKGISNLACTVCGLSALKTGMIAANLLGANQGQLLYYANSGDVTKEKKNVVGYGTLALIKNPHRPAIKLVEPMDTGKQELLLSEDEKQELLHIARSAIAEGMATGTQLLPATSRPALLERRAVFVTLKRKDVLQGCIGMTEARLPLYQAVAQMACAAAFEDPRFKPLTADQLPYMDLEISVLSPLQRIQNPSEIILGVHGVVVKRGNKSGLFLPQVATETGWTKEQFLNNLCHQKAHLPNDAWRDKKTELYIFRVTTFQQPAPADKVFME